VEIRIIRNRKKTVDERGLFKKGTSSGGGEKPGTEGGEGNGTSPKGGTGKGKSGYGPGLHGRPILHRPTVRRENNEDGIVMVKITVNRQGRVIKSEGGQKGSTITDVNTVSRAEKIASQYKFAEDPNGPESVSDLILIDFRPQ
jgi:colicin import membrane protein